MEQQEKHRNTKENSESKLGKERKGKESNQDIDKKITSSGMLRRVALVKTDVSEKRTACIITATRIDELETTLAITTIYS
jgi:hypothetical protein